MIRPGARTGQAERKAPGPIPHTVSTHACIDFVNSRFNDHTGSGAAFDRIDRKEWQVWFARRCGVEKAQPPDAATLRRLRALRTLLRTLLESRTPPDAGQAAVLERHLSLPSQSWHLVRQARRLRPQQRWNGEPWHVVMAVVALDYAQLLAGGELELVRVCANPDCSYMFHDDTRNGSRRWCQTAICGNLVKVRRHRARISTPGRAVDENDHHDGVDV